MTNSSETQREVIDNLRLDVGVIKSQMVEVRDLQKSMSIKMDGFTFAKQIEVDKLSGVAERVENRLTVLEQRLKPIEKIYYLILGAIVTGIVGLGFYLVQKAFG